MAHGDAREGKWRGNWRMEWVTSTLHTTSEHGVPSITTADARTSAANGPLNNHKFFMPGDGNRMGFRNFRVLRKITTITRRVSICLVMSKNSQYLRYRNFVSPSHMKYGFCSSLTAVQNISNFHKCLASEARDEHENVRRPSCRMPCIFVLF